MRDLANFILKIIGVCLMVAALVCFLAAYRDRISACCYQTKEKITGKKYSSEYDDYADV